MKSDSAGNFRFVNLVPADYKIEILADNFKRFVRTPIAVQVGSAVRLDVPLEVGTTSETVEVTTQAPLLQTESGQMSQQVEGTTVQEMPLNGRNTMNLIALTAGVVPQGASMGSTSANQNSGNTSNLGWGNYQIGGGIAGQSAQYLDGVAINVLGNSVAFVPTQDAVQEFSVASNSVSADFGRFGGGVVNMTTKSGANKLHGALYEYLRNTALNSNDWFNKKDQLTKGKANKPKKFNQNQYGVSASGPVLKDKAFFLFSWEESKVRFAMASPTNIPTTGMKTGQVPYTISAAPTGFTDGNGNNIAKVWDPRGVCNPTQNNAGKYWDLSACSINTAAKVFMKYYPDSVTGNAYTYDQFKTNNYYRAVNLGTDQKQYNIRMDYNMSTNQRIFGRYSYWNLGDMPFNQFPEIAKYNLGNGATKNTTNMIVLGDTYTINPTTILDVRLSWLRQHYDTDKPVKDANEGEFFPGAGFISQEQATLLPTFGLTGTRGLYAAWSRGPFNKSALTNYQLSANLVKIVGRHNFKMGTELRQMLGANTGSPNSGGFNFTGNYTGDEWSDFLLGYAKTGSLSQVSSYTAYNYYQAYYLQDSWQFNNKLTLNLGLRYELPGSIGEAHDKLLVLLPTALDPNTGVTGSLFQVNTPQYGRRTIQAPSKRLIAPRFGFAYRVSNSTVVRGGYAVAYLPPDLFQGAAGPGSSGINSASTSLDNSQNVNANGTFASSFVTMTNPFPSGLLKPTGALDSKFMANRLFTTAISGAVPTSVYPYNQQWNLSVSRQMKGDWVIDAGYVAAKGTHLAAIAGGLNQLSSVWWNASDNTTRDAVLTTPMGGYTKTVTRAQARRPFPYYSNLTDANPYWGASTYHSLQVKAEKRFKSGGILMGSYTWAKQIGDTDSMVSNIEAKSSTTSEAGGYGKIQDMNNHQDSRSILSYNVPSRVVISYVMPLPFGKGQKYLNSSNAVVSRLVSGWAVNGITTFQTGFSLGLQEASTNQLTGSYGAGQLRPNYTSGCNKSVNGDPRARLTQWFNTACFTRPGDWAFGNTPRVDGQLRAQGINNWDFSVLKTTKLFENATFEFRGEFFNIANRTQFAPPYVWRGQSTFGTVVMQANQPRLVQFSARLKF